MTPSNRSHSRYFAYKISATEILLLTTYQPYPNTVFKRTCVPLHWGDTCFSDSVHVNLVWLMHWCHRRLISAMHWSPGHMLMCSLTRKNRKFKAVWQLSKSSWFKTTNLKQILILPSLVGRTGLTWPNENDQKLTLSCTTELVKDHHD